MGSCLAGLIFMVRLTTHAVVYLFLKIICGWPSQFWTMRLFLQNFSRDERLLGVYGALDWWCKKDAYFYQQAILFNMTNKGSLIVGLGYKNMIYYEGFGDDITPSIHKCYWYFACIACVFHAKCEDILFKNMNESK